MKLLHPFLVSLFVTAFIIHSSAQVESAAPLSRSAPFQTFLQKTITANDTQTTAFQKSKGRAALFSLLVPGTGELYLGNRKLGTIFLTSELTLWGTYFLTNWISDVKEDDYILYATSHAGINPAAKPHQFYVNIENYENIDEYNQAMLQRRSVRDLYPENGTYGWNWDEETFRKKFKRMRVSSDRYKNAGLFMIGGVVLNHIVSAIDVMRIVNQQNSSDQTSNPVQVHFTGLPQGGMTISLIKHF